MSSYEYIITLGYPSPGMERKKEQLKNQRLLLNNKLAGKETLYVMSAKGIAFRVVVDRPVL